MSKRGMEMQGGADRYGGSDGPETPTDTPRQATAAQLARRKIANIRRPARATSPNKTSPSFGALGQQQPNTNGTQPTQTGFSFNQTNMNGSAGMSNGFAFGQSQSSPAVGFSFGQSQQNGPSSFTFGQPTANGTFSFNAGAAAASFPPANNPNPFTAISGQQIGTNGFQGNIFNIPGTADSPQSALGATNGFSFGTNSSTAPSTPSTSFSNEDADKKEIESREPYLNAEQQRQVEQLVATHLPDSLKAYSAPPLSILPATVVSQVAQYLRSLQSLNHNRNATSLFVEPYRPKSKRPWVTDAERAELKNVAPSLTPDQQARLGQIVKDNVEPLRSKSDSELPSFEYLPNDVQSLMLDFIRVASDDAQTLQKAADASVTANGTDQETPKLDPFASLESSGQAPALSESKSNASFSLAAPSSSSIDSASGISKASQALSQPVHTAATAHSEGENAPVKTTENDQAKSNPFALIARPSISANSLMKPNSSSPGLIKNHGASAKPTNVFNFSSINSSASSTPVKPGPNFESSSMIHISSSQSKIPGQGPVVAPSPNASSRQSLSGSLTSAAAPTKSNFAPAQPIPNSDSVPETAKTDSSRVPIPNFYHPEDGDSLVTLVAKTGVLNACFRDFLQQQQTYADWSPTVRYYLQELQKLKDAIAKEEMESDKNQHEAKASQNLTKPFGAMPAPRDMMNATNGKRNSDTVSEEHVNSESNTAVKRQKSMPGFQISSPSKPLSATANIFNNILSRPDKTESTPADTTSNGSQVPTKPASSVFAFKPVAAASPAAPAAGVISAPLGSSAAPAPKLDVAPSILAPKFEIPKFGGVQGGQANFMSIFGAKAAKEAEKAKQKRKDEDFDSDEDEEDEWEKRDQQKQAQKKLELASKANKVMKMVNGSFQWVDADQATSTHEQQPVTRQQQSNGPSVFSDPAVGSSATASNPFAFLSNKAASNGLKGPPSEPAEGPGEQGEDTEDESDEENRKPAESGPGDLATPVKTPSLFDRIDKEPAASNNTGSNKPLFSFSSGSPAGDQTWKPETPIKFGGFSTETAKSTTPAGSPAKPLFSFPTSTSQTQASGTSTNEAPKFTLFQNIGQPSSTPSHSTPNVGFKFGASSTTSLFPSSQPVSSAPSIFSSNAGSRASTPGATTADDASTTADTDNEEDAAPREEQRDLTSLSADELKTEDVLFEGKARCRLFDRADASGWVNKGIGIIRLLKNKVTGNERVLMRLAPGGQIVINANVMKDRSVYSVQGGKNVKLVFAEEDGLKTYMASFGTSETAKELVGKIKDGA